MLARGARRRGNPRLQRHARRAAQRLRVRVPACADARLLLAVQIVVAARVPRQRELTRLVVCDNALNGPLPGEGLALLTALEELDLSRNMFTGIVAVELPNRLGRHLRLVRKERRQLGFA